MSPDTSSVPVRQAAEAWESLFRTQVGVMRRLQKDPAFKNLTMREYDVLFNLTRCPTGWIRLNELNEHLLISQPSLSRMVERMEAKGLVQRRPAQNDQRGVELALTDEGRDMQRRLGRVHVQGIHELLSPALSSEELNQLKLLTDKVLASLAASDD
ncbi:MarR family winged helix-turn-helix transcriptional regulator [Arthrobacter sp. zg-Y820]|uniref:MarR family winged helix-turn-helix transcriptional regulator n=1 Tax=unclassified Arthrobacter TaxID=235627 RepID=UPI001E4DC069|nr:MULTISPECIES: MarR family winged helix-turn-helix transcriptional regulator [unclassified Arthrobacter]MCC9196148.1 MarR family winged helix-turn-helix transcriptional regulator [Arthrobacter sp. zg-Y820]MDK1279008.1 MarR family winged helix-turn-helix transcriptional regulator [Arthrobacter sp. zg.Y820]MDK1359376.1 MarR family winged helix-turn-helix transcriptional regulator [Arthrobacter sp. zg-Y1219]WIB08582.1 MarR family winged helix-turn-helix transcriptional regulator [Arthrobacter sp